MWKGRPPSWCARTSWLALFVTAGVPAALSASTLRAVPQPTSVQDGTSGRPAPSIPSPQAGQTYAGRIVGTVTSQGQPVGGAAVTVGGQSVVSDATGSFTIDGVSGTVDLTVRMIGYETQTRSVSVAGETRVSVDLTPVGVSGFDPIQILDSPVQWNWWTWLLLLAELIGLEVALRRRRGDEIGVRGAAITGVAAGSLVGNLAMIGYYMSIGVDPDAALLVESGLIVAGAATTVALVFRLWPAFDTAATRVLAGAGAGFAVSGVIGLITYLMFQLPQPDPMGNASGLAVPAWAGAAEGAMLVAWLTLRPVIARRFPVERPAMSAA